METVYLSLGSNLGDRFLAMQHAIASLSQILAHLKSSTLYECEPVGMPEGTPWFLNAVACGSTDLTPEQLLAATTRIETALGRVRSENRYESRTIDIDILFYGHTIVQAPTLTIPHPDIEKRKFVLVPMAELSPRFLHPGLKRTIWELLADCTDTATVQKFHGFTGF